MTDLPYTEDDLRAEAASQHAYLTEDPEFLCVGEAMDDDIVASTEDGPTLTWGEILPDENAFNAAQKKIRDLIVGAADLSEWAVNLGADGLQPTPDCLSLKSGDRPIVRVHFAFDPDMPEEMRQSLIEGLGESIASHL